MGSEMCIRDRHWTALRLHRRPLLRRPSRSSTFCPPLHRWTHLRRPREDLTSSLDLRPWPSTLDLWIALRWIPSPPSALDPLTAFRSSRLDLRRPQGFQHSSTFRHRPLRWTAHRWTEISSKAMSVSEDSSFPRTFVILKCPFCEVRDLRDICIYL